MRTVRALLAVVALASCAKGGFHESCTTSGDCAGGLQCLPSMVQSGDTCTQHGSTCGRRCTTSDDCAALGDGAACATDCMGAKSCVRR
jgi:hypothetical protein